MEVADIVSLKVFIQLKCLIPRGKTDYSAQSDNSRCFLNEFPIIHRS